MIATKQLRNSSSGVSDYHSPPSPPPPGRQRKAPDGRFLLLPGWRSTDPPTVSAGLPPPTAPVQRVYANVTCHASLCRDPPCPCGTCPFTTISPTTLSTSSTSTMVSSEAPSIFKDVYRICDARCFCFQVQITPIASRFIL